MKLLIVEDDPDLKVLYEKTLKLHNQKIIGSVSDGCVAVKYYKLLEEKPDLILMDYHLPVFNGLEASKKILEINSNQKIMMISGNDEIKREALVIGAVDRVNIWEHAKYMKWRGQEDSDSSFVGIYI